MGLRVRDMRLTCTHHIGVAHAGCQSPFPPRTPPVAHTFGRRGRAPPVLVTTPNCGNPLEVLQCGFVLQGRGTQARPVVDLANAFKVNKHVVLEDPEDLTFEWLNTAMGIVVK